MTKSDGDLAALAQKGDTEALEELIERYRLAVKKIARGFYLSGAEPDDVIQEGMIGLCKAITSWKPEEPDFEPFACMCIKRQIISAVRAATTQGSSPLNDYISIFPSGTEEEDSAFAKLEAELSEKGGEVSRNPEETVEVKESLEERDRVLKNTLSVLEYGSLKLYTDGYSYTEAASILGTTVKSIENALKRARNKLKEQIL